MSDPAIHTVANKIRDADIRDRQRLQARLKVIGSYTKKGKMKMTKLSTMLWALLLSSTALAANEREITVTLTVPDAVWEISIDEVHVVNNEVWVISTVSRDPDMMGAQVISVVKASIKCVAADGPVKHFILGKTWNWPNQEPYTFIKTRQELDKGLKSGKPLYKRALGKPCGPLFN